MSATRPDNFHHEAFFYADADEFLARTVPFVAEGIEAEESILVALPQRNLDLLRGALDGAADRVQFVDMAKLGRNPGRIISAWQDFLDGNHPSDRGVRGIGQPIWADRSAAELDECQRHETLLNLAFGDGPAWPLLCPYDTAELDDAVLAVAEHSHPVLSGRERGTEYSTRPVFGGVLERPHGRPAEMSFDRESLGQVRGLVAEQARRAGLQAERIGDLMLAVSEITTNSVRHGGGEGTVKAWIDDGAVICDIRDRGRIEDPLIGRRRPGWDQEGGRGVWLAHQLCDLVQIRWDGDNVVRLQMSPQ